MGVSWAKFQALPELRAQRNKLRQPSPPFTRTVGCGSSAPASFSVFLNLFLDHPLQFPLPLEALFLPSFPFPGICFWIISAFKY